MTTLVGLHYDCNITLLNCHRKRVFRIQLQNMGNLKGFSASRSRGMICALGFALTCIVCSNAHKSLCLLLYVSPTRKSCLVLYIVLSWVWSCLVSSCLDVSCLVSSCLVSYLVLYRHVLYLTLSCTLPYLVLSCTVVLSCILSCLLYRLVLYRILSCILSYLVSCLVLSCLALSYLILSCLVFYNYVNSPKRWLILLSSACSCSDKPRCQ